MREYRAKIFLSEKQFLLNAQKKLTEFTEKRTKLTALPMP